MEIEKKKSNKALLGLIISLCGLGAVYLGTSVYFVNHFNVGSKINLIDVSGKTVDEANLEVMSKIGSYELNLEGRDGINDMITANDINLQCDLQNRIKEIKDTQSALRWIGCLFKSENTNISDVVVYDENKLEDKIDKSLFMKSENIVEPQNATLKYNDGHYG